MDDIVSRLKAYMVHIGLPSTQFADFAGIPRPTISQIINGRNKKISNELIAKLHSAFPTLNILWLMFGDGDMEVKTNIKTSQPQKSSISKETNTEIIEKEEHIKPLDGLFNDNFQLRNSNIDEFAEDNINDEVRSLSQELPYPPSNTSFRQDSPRKIRYIMVYYNDNTFEVLTPDK